MVKITQLHLEPGTAPQEPLPTTADLAIVYCSRRMADAGAHLPIVEALPDAVVVGATSAGHFAGPELSRGTLAVTVIQFDHTTVRTAFQEVHDDGEAAGEAIGAALAADDLAAVVVLSEGAVVNGSALSRGLSTQIGPDTPVVGGLAANGLRFSGTAVLHDGAWHERGVVAVGLYGDRLLACAGLGGGWRPFGPERMVTCSDGNRLRTLDGGSALELYQRYLAPVDEALPAAALRFPISVVTPTGQRFVRSVQSFDPDDGSITMAGDVPQGSRARLMRSHTDTLVEGARTALAELQCDGSKDASSRLALLFSCVGRRLVMKDRVEEELEAACESLGPNTAIAGFYGYGEIGSDMTSGAVELHNQTITALVLSES